MSELSNLRDRWLKPGMTAFKHWLAYPSSPKKIALSFTFGFYLGLFPLVGSTTILCLLATFLFRLNPLIVQAVNFSLFPLQLVLIYPFMKAGRMLFFTRKDLLPDVSPEQLINAAGWDYFYQLGESIAGGIAVWLICAILTGFVLYRSLLWIVKNYYSKQYP